LARPEAQTSDAANHAPAGRPAHLALAQRDREQAPAHPLVGRQLPQPLGRVDAGRQNKHQRRRRRRVGERLGQVEHRGLDEAAAERRADKRGGGEHDAVGAQAAGEQHAVEVAEAGLPLARQLGGLGLGAAGSGVGSGV
jgi:hypothetical protein